MNTEISREMLATARRNIRQFLIKASFSSEIDRAAALGCVDVMEEAIECAKPKPEAVRLRDELREGGLTDKQVYDQFEFLEGMVNVPTYRLIVDRAINIQQAALAATGKQQVGEEVSVEEDVYHSIADLIEPYVQREGTNPDGPLPASVHDSVQIIFDHWLKSRAQVGEVQGDSVEHAKNLDLLRAGYHVDAAPRAAALNAAITALAAHQPVGQEPVDVEAALAAGDPDWQAQCRPNLRGSERLFFAVRDIAEMRAMLSGEKKPLPGSGLAVVRVNPNAPSVVPYQCAHRLLGDAYQAGEQGVGYCDQAEELFVSRTTQAKRDGMAVVYAAPPTQAVPNGKLVAWWNGITPGHDGQGNYSIRWGANAEDSGHDIPLYDGINPIHYQTPTQDVDLRQFRPIVQNARTRLANSVDQMRVQLGERLRPEVRERIKAMFDEDQLMLRQADDLLAIIDSGKAVQP